MRHRDLRQDQPDAIVVLAEFLTEWAQILHFVPVKFVHIQNEPVPAAIQRVPEPLSKMLGIGGGKDAFEAHPNLLPGRLEIDLDGEVRADGLGLEFLPDREGAPAFFRQAVGCALQFGMLEIIIAQGHGGPQGGARGQPGFGSLGQGGAAQLGVNLALQIRDPFPDGGIRSEPATRAEHRVSVPQFLRIL